MRSFVFVAALLLATAASAVRPPLQSDFDRCTLRAQDAGAGAHLGGSVRLHLLARKDGSVFAAFVHSERGDVARSFSRCVLYTAMLWKVAPSQLDYEWPWEVRVFPGGANQDLVQREDPQRPVWENGSGEERASVMQGNFDEPPDAAPIEVVTAQATLELADSATDAERGLAELAVGRTEEAIPLLRRALETDPADAAALRGLAEAQVRKGELAAARATAAHLAELAPDSEIAHEALLRVCLGEGDDACAFAEFHRANKAPDLSLRWVTLRDELLQPARAAAARLRACSASFESAALCAVKRCAGDGDFRVQLSGAVALVSSGESRWLVKDAGDQLRIVPSNAAARGKLQRCSR